MLHTRNLELRFDDPVDQHDTLRIHAWCDGHGKIHHVVLALLHLVDLHRCITVRLCGWVGEEEEEQQQEQEDEEREEDKTKQ